MKEEIEYIQKEPTISDFVFFRKYKSEIIGFSFYYFT